ncbi:hypothetical protein CsSME_00023116 [Camellia sinensis var. sinensis]
MINIINLSAIIDIINISAIIDIINISSIINISDINTMINVLCYLIVLCEENRMNGTNREEKEEEGVTVFFKVAAGIDGIELGDGGIGGGRRNLKRLAFDDVRNARSNAEEVRVRNNAESFVVVENTALVVIFGIRGIDHGTKLWREREGRFEYARVLFW